MDRQGTAEQPAVDVSSSVEIKAENEDVTVNGTESKECTSVASEQPIKTEELTKSESSVVSKEEPAPEAPPAEPETPAPVVEEVKEVKPATPDPVEEIITATQDLKIEASPVVENTPEPVPEEAEKEVRNKETPPPLPVSPPPPPVSVLALSTMADSIPADILVTASSIQPSSVEQETIVAEPAVVEQVETITDLVEKVDDKPTTEEPVLAAQVEIVSEPQIEKVSEPVPEPQVEPIPQIPVPEIAEVVPEPVVESVPEPVVESVPEPVVESVSEPVVESLPEPVVEPLPPQPEPEIPDLPSDLPEPVVESVENNLPVVESPSKSEKQPELSDVIDSLPPPPPPPVEETASQPSFLIESLPETESDIVETSEVDSLPSSDQPSLAPESIDPVVQQTEKTIDLAENVPKEIIANETNEAAQDESSSPVAKVDSVPVTSAPLLNDTVLSGDVAPEIKQNSVEKIDTTACAEESRDAAPKAENQEPAEADGVAVKAEE